MKLRTSFFDFSVFKKNLTRFAPAWGLYTVAMLLGLLLMADSGLEYWLPANLGECIQLMPIINCGYALVVAQLIFGDLFNTRMCNALHALPLRRETWFATNVISGLAFSFGPTLVLALIALPLMSASFVVGAWQLPLLWLLGVNLQFLFFFATAVLCVFCAGSRFAQVLLYAIINLGANIAFWLADTIYVPMLFGIETQYDAFLAFFPVGRMLEEPYIDMQRIYGEYDAEWVSAAFTLTDQWNYLWLCAGLAVLMLVLALLLYRRRRLETAGDFMAVKPLEPVFLVLYCLIVAAFFQMCYDLFFSDQGYFFLFIGLVIGFFTGRMLLERRVNVFRLKNWAALGILALGIAVSLVLTWLDPLGITRFVPKAESIDRAIVSMGYHYGYGNSELPLKTPEDIENVLAVHRAALEDRIGETERTEELITDPKHPDGCYYYYHSPVPITIRYELKNGTTVTRYYHVWPHEEEGQLVEKWFSSLSCVTGTDSLLNIPGEHRWLSADGFEVPYEYLEGENFRKLLEAIEKDCAEGNLAQNWSFHQNEYVYESPNASIHSLNLDLVVGGFGTQFEIYGDSRHTLAWLEETGVLEYIWTEYYGEKYDK